MAGMSLIRSIACLVVLGCGPAVAEYRPAPTTTVTTAAPSNASLHLLVAPAVGCVAFKPGTLPSLRCFDLEGSSDESYKAQVVAATKEPNVAVGYYIPNHGAALAAALQAKFGAGTTVAMVGQDSQPGAVVRSELNVSPALVVVTLHVKLASGVELSASGSAVPAQLSPANLAWALPVLIVFFPSSEFWVPPIFTAMHHHQIADAIPVAMGIAASSLATQIAAQPSGSP